MSPEGGRKSMQGERRNDLMWTFCLHEVKRMFIYSLRQKKSMWSN